MYGNGNGNYMNPGTVVGFRFQHQQAIAATIPGNIPPINAEITSIMQHHQQPQPTSTTAPPVSYGLPPGMPPGAFSMIHHQPGLGG